MNTQTKYIAYYRVSTVRQGQSGLGLDAQQQATAHYNVVREFTDVESGTKSDRPQLQAALKACESTGATLLIAKLDRLARNVLFISKLMESGVEFVCCDTPQANKLTLHLMAAFAEHEAKAISERTKNALASAKRRGKKLGGKRAGAGRKVGSKGTPPPASLVTQVKQLRVQGLTFSQIAKNVNSQGWVTSRGNPHTKQSIQRLSKVEVTC